MLAIGCDGAVDQTRVERGEPVGMDKILATGGWRKILDKDVSAADQSRIDVSGILRCRLLSGRWRSTALCEVARSVRGPTGRTPCRGPRLYSRH